MDANVSSLSTRQKCLELPLPAWLPPACIGTAFPPAVPRGRASRREVAGAAMLLLGVPVAIAALAVLCLLLLVSLPLSAPFAGGAIALSAWRVERQARRRRRLKLAWSAPRSLLR